MGESAKKKPRLPKAEEEPTFDPDPIVLSSDDEADDDLSFKIVENGNPSSSSSSLQPQVKKRKKRTKETKKGAQDNAASTSNSVEKDFYFASVTFRSQINKTTNEVKKYLREVPGREDLFQRTCFGRLLDIPMVHNEPALVHWMLWHEDTPRDAVDYLRYVVHGVELRYTRRDFCLITGFEFGPSVAYPSMPADSFRRRLWPDVPVSDPLPGHLLVRWFTSDTLRAMSDEDAIRVCLLMVFEVVFMGRQGHGVVFYDALRRVEDLDHFNSYPWGNVLWTHTQKIMINAVPRRNWHIVNGLRDPDPKYTLPGFLLPFKIWILETFPISRDWYCRDEGVFPRAVAWRRHRTMSRDDVVIWGLRQDSKVDGVSYPPSSDSPQTIHHGGTLPLWLHQTIHPDGTLLPWQRPVPASATIASTTFFTFATFRSTTFLIGFSVGSNNFLTTFGSSFLTTFGSSFLTTFLAATIPSATIFATTFHVDTTSTSMFGVTTFYRDKSSVRFVRGWSDGVTAGSLWHEGDDYEEVTVDRGFHAASTPTATFLTFATFATTFLNGTTFATIFATTFGTTFATAFVII